RRSGVAIGNVECRQIFGSEIYEPEGRGRRTDMAAVVKIFIGMETSGELRRRFKALGHEVISCDILPSEDRSPWHVIGDVFETLSWLETEGWVPDLGVF